MPCCLSAAASPGWRRRASRPPCTLGCSVLDRKSTRLNSSHSQISYAVFCLKKKRSPKLSRTRSPLALHLTNTYPFIENSMFQSTRPETASTALALVVSPLVLVLTHLNSCG